MSLLKKVFSNLHWRFNSENDLSDMTWVICETSLSFQQLFLNFFFPNVRFDKIISFSREVSKDGSRADFLVNNDGVEYVIECKIHDKNHHFEQYLKTYNLTNDRLGYIVNYPLVKEGFVIKGWTELHDYLESNLPEDTEEKELYQLYLDYLRNVCGIIKINSKVELNGIYSLFAFNIILKSVISRDENNYRLSFYNTDFKESYYGYKFKVESKINDKEDIWLNVGLWFKYEKPVITIGVWNNKGWGKPFYDELSNNNKNFEFKYSRKFYLEDSSYYFEGSHLFYCEFQDSKDPVSQKLVLSKFVDEVVNFYINS